MERHTVVILVGLLLVFISSAADGIFSSHSYSVKLQQQAIVPESKAFPCPLGNNAPGARSELPPTSVHELRPGDIDVIASIGDSLSAATAALSTNLAEVFQVDNRGMSWIAGGQRTWREYLTLPNILKLYNANLTGYSLGNGKSENKNAQFNVAVAGAMDQDMIYEAIELVRRLKNDKRVDMKKHWKLISFWVGTNDLCSDYCYDPNQGVDAHIANIQATLDYLYQHVPRSFVLLVSSPYIPGYAELKDLPNICLSSLPFECSCLLRGKDEHTKVLNVTITTRMFQRAEQELAESGRYDSREDFTVQFQPTFMDATFPLRRKRNGHLTTDYSYLAVDCFHYSQKLHAISANTIWNNLLEPPWDKTTTWRPMFERFLCPSLERPYIISRQNSKHWRMGRD